MKLVFATHNKHKFEEVRQLLPPEFELVNLNDIGCTEDIAETETTIEGNAMLKARYIKDNYDLSCFADDSGLEVNALDGAPGVYSARYAGPGNDAEANMTKLLQEMKGVSDRTAQFKTVIALIWGNEQHLFTGICKGVITEVQRGSKGFGYDPIFLPEGYSQTFAEMDSDTKGGISHRGMAVNTLINYLKEFCS